MKELLLLGVISFTTVGLKGFQHKNVIGGHLKLVVATSYLMALGDIFLINGIVSTGFSSFWYVGTGSALGMLCSILIHDKFIKSKP